MKISIITPNYNYASFIEQTIRSVIYQKYNNFEHIIVDDGSTDNSVDVIQKYVEKYPNKIIMIKQENKGQTYAINEALKHAKGDIIGWINSDDFYFENIFSTIVETFKKDTSIDAIMGDIAIIYEKEELVRINKYLGFD